MFGSSLLTKAIAILRRISQPHSNQYQNMFTQTELRGELVKTFLNLEQLDTNLFRSTHQMPNLNTTVIYGGQVIGQSLVAALKTVPSWLHPHSLHCYFLKAGNSNVPILYHVDRVRDGKSFCTRGIKAVQDGDNIFSCQLSFHKDEPDSISHQDAMPQVSPPENLKDAVDLMREFLKSDGLSENQRASLTQRINAHSTFCIRPVDADAYLRIKPKSAKQCVWLKSKETIGNDLRLHLCVAAYMSDFALVGTMMMPHNGTGFKVGMAMSLDHSMWFHRYKFSIDDDWLLYETSSSIACSARGFATGRLWTRNGDLVISTAQEGLIRGKL